MSREPVIPGAPRCWDDEPGCSCGGRHATVEELQAITTALGRAAARWELARARYVEASREQPRGGPPPAEGGAPTARNP